MKKDNSEITKMNKYEQFFNSVNKIAEECKNFWDSPRIEARGKYLRFKAEVFDLIEKNSYCSNNDLNILKEALSNTEQRCLGRGINADNLSWYIEKSAALFYLFKHKFSVNEENRGKYAQNALIISGYNLEEREKIKGIVKRKEKGILETRI